MLVLTRKVHQQIRIGDQITVTIVRVKGQTVRVGIDAPSDVRVLRGELSAACPSSGSERAQGAEHSAEASEASGAAGRAARAADEDPGVPVVAAGGRRRRAALDCSSSAPVGAVLPA